MKTTARVYVWLTNQPEPLNIACTSIGGMESQGWVPIKTVDIDIDLGDIDLVELKNQQLISARDALLDRHHEELMLIEDSIRLSKEL